MTARLQMILAAQSSERGAFLVELLITVVILAVGLLALGQLFPAGSRSQLSSRMASTAEYYSQQKAEELQGLTAADPNLSAGRHPPGAAVESLGGRWARFYEIDILPAPLSAIRRVAINVSWNYQGLRSVNDTIYLRR
jgi:type II secretory pathway pseudopilin PulG